MPPPWVSLLKEEQLIHCFTKRLPYASLHQLLGTWKQLQLISPKNTSEMHFIMLWKRVYPHFLISPGQLILNSHLLSLIVGFNVEGALLLSVLEELDLSEVVYSSIGNRHASREDQQVICELVDPFNRVGGHHCALPALLPNLDHLIQKPFLFQRENSKRLIEDEQVSAVWEGVEDRPANWVIVERSADPQHFLFEFLILHCGVSFSQKTIDFEGKS